MQATTETKAPNLRATARTTAGAALYARWAFQLAAAGILGSTLFFKFTGAPESVALFERLGVEPWGRLGLGTVELVAVLLLLAPRGAALGALLTLGLMGGAIASHLAILGIEVDGDGGALFAMAVGALVSALAVLALRRAELAELLARTLARRKHEA